MTTPNTQLANELLTCVDEHRLVILEQRKRLQALPSEPGRESQLKQSAVTALWLATQQLETAIRHIESIA